MDCKVCLVLDEVYQSMRCVGATGVYRAKEDERTPPPNAVLATEYVPLNIYQCARCKSIDIE